MKICLPLDLCIGKLDDVGDFNRFNLNKYIDKEEYKPFNNGYDFKEEFQKMCELIKDADKIRVWSRHLDCDDYCLLLFICNYFSDKNISVIFSEEYSWYATTISMLDEGEVKELSNKERKLRNYEIEQYKEEWKKIIKENTQLRYMLNGIVKSVDINYFDSEILNRLNKLGKVNIYSLVANLMQDKNMNKLTK